MFRSFVAICLLIGICSFGQAQNPFYGKILADARVAMEVSDQDLAKELLEIAAFGMMEDRKAKKEIYIRMVVLQDDSDNKTDFVKYRTRANQLLAEIPGKPELLDEATWNKFLVLTGKRTPPVPSSESKLVDYLKEYPKSVKAWRRLASLQSSSGDARKAQKTLADGMRQAPNDEGLLADALQLDIDKNRAKEADELAERLQALAPNHPLVNEYLGNKAVDNKDYDKAELYYGKVSAPSLADTAKYQGLLRQALELRREEEEKRTARLQKEKEGEDRRTQARLEKERQDEERRNKAELAKKERDAEREKTRLAKLENDKMEAERKVSARAEREKKAGSKPSESASNKDAKKVSSKKPKETTVAVKDPLKELEARYRKDSGNADLQYQLVTMYLARQDLYKARKVLNKLGKNEPNTMRYAESFAHYNYLRRDYDKIISSFGRRKSMSEMTRYYLGMSYYHTNEFENARRSLQSLDRTKFNDLTRIDKVIQRQTKPEEKASSKATSEKAALETPQTSGKLDRVSLLELKVKGKDATLQDQVELLGIYVEKDDWRSARRLLRKTAIEYPRSPDVSYYTARQYLQDKNYKRASRMFNNLANSNYRKNETYYYGGYAAFKAGDFALAKYMFNRAEANGTRFKKEIDELKKQNVTDMQVFTSEQVESKIRELEDFTSKYTYTDPRISLLRMYAVTGEQEKFNSMVQELKQKKLSKVQQSLVQSWTLYRENRFEEASAIIATYLTDEAQFLKGYLFYQVGERSQASPLLAKLADSDEFPEIALLLND